MKKEDKFREITNSMLQTYIKKNKDYGDSFSNSLDEFGLVAAITRIGDKFNRIKSLIKKKGIQVKEESIIDTLLDMANYCIMTKMWLENNNLKEISSIDKEFKEIAILQEIYTIDLHQYFGTNKMQEYRITV